MSEQQYLDWCKKWIDEGIRTLKPGGSFFLYNLPKWNVRLACHLEHKLTFKHWIVVDKKQSLPISGRLYPAHYSLLYYVKGARPNTFNPPRQPLEICRHCGHEIKDYGGYKHKMNTKGISLTDVWDDIPPVRHKKYKTRGANELHLKFMDRILDIATVAGDTILDPFGGSGTTYVAAELKKRKWIGVELSTTSEIVKRLKNSKSDKDHFDAFRTRVNSLFPNDSVELRAKFARTPTPRSRNK